MRRKYSITLTLLAALAFAASSSFASEASTPRQLSFGVVPQQAASKLARLWGPILKHLSDETGYQLRFHTAPSIPVFEERLANGQYDIAYMNPYHYTVFSRAPGYAAFAKAKNKKIKGIIVVRKDSPLQELAELTGSLVAFPAPAAFAASVLPRAHFSNAGINVTPKYVSSHDSVYRTVAKGLYPAGGGVMRTFNTVAEDVRAQLRVLWVTEPYTSHAIAAHPGLPPEVVESLLQAMLAMNEDETAQALLAQLSWQGVEAADDGRWNDVRSLGIDLLDQLINQK